MKITVYDGATTIGGNKIYVEEEGSGVFLDFGMNFAKYGRYFAEFLSERSTRGIHDSLHLNLIPKLNIYRRDLIPSDVNVAHYPKLNVEAVLLSHAHLDHCGNISFLDERIPVIASAMTIAILKAMRDTGSFGVGSEIAYFTIREPSDDPRVLKSTKNNIPYRGRDFICTDSLTNTLTDFLCYRPGQESKNSKKLEPGDLCSLGEEDLSFSIEHCSVDHSIYGANAYVIGDTIAYTGDLRLHGKYAKGSKEFIKKARNVSILITEGTRAGGREEIIVSEEEVFYNCLKAVEESKDLVIADFSPRNFERLETFMEIAKKTGRELVISAKDAYMLHAMECVDGVCRLKNVRIYKDLKDRKSKWELAVEERWGESYLDPFEIRSKPESYILCFSYYDMKHLLDIKPRSGTYIYSSTEAFSEEQEFDFQRLYNWLKEFGLVIYGFEMVIEKGKVKPKFIKGYHASGHVSSSDLRRMIDEIDPDIIIPVHTGSQKWFEREFEKAKILGDGKSFEFNN